MHATKQIRSCVAPGSGCKSESELINGIQWACANIALSLVKIANSNDILLGFKLFFA